MKMRELYETDDLDKFLSQIDKDSKSWGYKKMKSNKVKDTKAEYSPEEVKDTSDTWKDYGKKRNEKPGTYHGD